MRFMIVDDSPGVRTTIRRILSHGEDAFCECNDGAEAVERYERFHPDWVLMDIRMKEMDGITATGKILGLDPKARIIIITQYADPRAREEAMRAGAVAFVPKEDLSDLHGIITKH